MHQAQLGVDNLFLEVNLLKILNLQLFGGPDFLKNIGHIDTKLKLTAYFGVCKITKYPGLNPKRLYWMTLYFVIRRQLLY